MNEKVSSDDAQENDLRPEEVARSKQTARINALLMVTVFLLMAFGPPRWRIYAPLLFLVPFIYRMYKRFKSAAPGSETSVLPEPSWKVPESSEQPYSQEPRDPKDPRRYKPIG